MKTHCTSRNPLAVVILLLALVILAAGLQGCKGRGVGTGPAVFFSSFVSADDKVERTRKPQVVVDEEDNIIVVGHTEFAGPPATAGTLNVKAQGGSDIFIAKFDPELKTLLAATFLGGPGDESELCAALDGEGNLYIGGMTTSQDFPARGKVFCPDPPEGATKIFLAKVSADLTELLGAAVLSHESDPRAILDVIVIDEKNDRVIVSGATSMPDFPVTEGAFQTKYGGGRSDEYIAIFNPGLNMILNCTYLGGSDYDSTYFSMAQDSEGNVFIGGNTFSADFPVTDGAYQTKFAGGNFMGHVSKLKSDLSALLASTFIAETGTCFAYCLDVDSEGRALFAGHVSDTFPTTEGAYRRTNSGIPDVANVGVLSNDLSELLASTFISGGGEGTSFGGFAWCSHVKADDRGNIYVMGQTGLEYYPTTPGAHDATLSGDADVFISMFDPDLTRLLASTFIGGRGQDRGGCLVFDKAGNVVIAGSTTSADFPVSAEAFDLSFKRSQDVFIAKFNAVLEETEAESSPVHRAAAEGDLRKLKSLLKEMPQLVLEEDRYGRTPLHWAARFGQEEAVELLLERMPDVEAVDKSKNTPLHLAALHEQAGAVKQLLDAGADPDLKNNSSHAPLHIAAYRGNVEVIDLLAEAKTSLDMEIEKGFTALHRAVWSRQPRAVEALLRLGLDINAKTTDGGGTPLHLAGLVYQNAETIALLIKNGASLNERDIDGMTPLRLAVEYPTEENGLELLKADPDFNVQDNEGRTALHQAAYRGRAAIVEELLRRGADTSLKDKDGKTALDVAVEAKQQAVVELLKRR